MFAQKNPVAFSLVVLFCLAAVSFTFVIAISAIVSLSLG